MSISSLSPTLSCRRDPLKESEAKKFRAIEPPKTAANEPGKFYEAGFWDFAGNRPASAAFAIAVLFCNPAIRVPFQNQLWLSWI
jgi:hypothetical protein